MLARFTRLLSLSRTRYLSISMATTPHTLPLISDSGGRACRGESGDDEVLPMEKGGGTAKGKTLEETNKRMYLLR